MARPAGPREVVDLLPSWGVEPHLKDSPPGKVGLCGSWPLLPICTRRGDLVLNRNFGLSGNWYPRSHSLRRRYVKLAAFVLLELVAANFPPGPVAIFPPPYECIGLLWYYMVSHTIPPHMGLYILHGNACQYFYPL